MKLLLRTILYAAISICTGMLGCDGGGHQVQSNNTAVEAGQTRGLESESPSWNAKVGRLTKDHDKKKIAAIITQYRAGFHADVIVTKFLKGFPTDEGFFHPRVTLASMYIDQTFDRDIGQSLAAEHGIPVYPSIVQALTLGGKDLAVDGVLLIGEHGDYAENKRQQKLYPRKYFMEQICGVMATSGRGVPVFNDKHLSYNWHDAKWMVDRAAEVGAPLMAGSVQPVTWRDPWLEHPIDAEITDAIAIGFSKLDSYGFHTLETLQCMVERRKGGESGVAAVTCLAGDAVWQAADQGLWSRELAETACSLIDDKLAGAMEEQCSNPFVMLVEYRDGFRGAALMLDGYVHGLAYAARVGDEVVATEFVSQGHGYRWTVGPYAHFSYLSLNVEEMFLSGMPAYPVERTLLTSGTLEAALISLHENSRRVQTPWLDVTYRSYESIRWRPRGPQPSGACLDPWPPAQQD
ncbi:MAG: hypothetical protein MK179_09220 [Pirellulaceae bacterium]|nr:hypothetical protein [Pirellulaceae bacterium]